eukprot:scaffold5.g884.t1
MVAIARALLPAAVAGGRRARTGPLRANRPVGRRTPGVLPAVLPRPAAKPRPLRHGVHAAAEAESPEPEQSNAAPDAAQPSSSTSSSGSREAGEASAAAGEASTSGVTAAEGAGEAPALTDEEKLAAALSQRGALAALGAVGSALGEVFRLLVVLPLRLLVLAPLAWVLGKLGLLALRPQEVIARLEEANEQGQLDADKLAAVLRALSTQHPAAVVEFFEARCMAPGTGAPSASGRGAAAASGGGGGGAGGGASGRGEDAAPPFEVNAAVVREYLSALVKSGRLERYGDDPDAPPPEGQSHASLARLLGALRAAAGGGAAALDGDPGASLARPLHVVVQARAEGPGGWQAAVQSFFYFCVTVWTLSFVWGVGVQAMRRYGGGPLAGGAGALGGAAPPGAVPSVSASSPAGMFAAKEYVKENLPERSVKRFSDVKGCDEAVEELQEIVAYLKSPDRFTRLGGRLPKGVLLTGPPGTGKTLLARAVAGEAGVPFFYKAGSEFDEMFVGVGSRRVRNLFAAAKKKAPCIIFIDEIDAVGGKRSNWESSGGSRKTLNQLLTDMDGFEENSGVVVMAATNLPELLDSALTRPGRFDRQVAVPLPDVRGRQEILELYLAGKPLTPDVDADLIARRTPGFRRVRLLDEARDKILMGAPRALTQTAEARRLTAYHEGGHALVALHTPGAKPIHKARGWGGAATIVPRGHALGMVSQVPDKDEYSTTKQQMLAHIDVCMGGKAAEELIFGEEYVTSGATSDLKQATRMARHMVEDCGMSSRIGPVAVAGGDKAQGPDVAKLLKAAYGRVEALLRQREHELHAVATALLQSETLTQARGWGGGAGRPAEIRQIVAAVNSPGGPSALAALDVGQAAAAAEAGLDLAPELPAAPVAGSKQLRQAGAAPGGGGGSDRGSGSGGSGARKTLQLKSGAAGQAATAPAAAPASLATVKGKAVVLLADYISQPPMQSLAVRLPDGKLMRVGHQSQAQIKGLRTGMALTVTGRLHSPTNISAATITAGRAPAAVPRVTAAAARAVRLGGARHGKAPGGKAWAAGAASSVVLSTSTNQLVESDVRTLFIPVVAVQADGSACPGTRLPPYTPAQLRSVIFAEANPGGPTVGKLFSQVSYGKTRLSAATSAVSDFVNIGCGGSSWALNSCGMADHWGWSDAAMGYATNTLKLDLSGYRHLVFVLPPGLPCDWAGQATVGCDEQCRAWTTGDFWSSVMMHAHELVRAADMSCVMGYCCSMRGYNLPHAWQAGWATVQQVDGSVLTPGTSLQLTLPTLATGAATNGARILPTWAPGREPVFLSYRTSAGADAALPDAYTRRTSIHTSAISNTYDASPTAFVTALADGQVWSGPGGLVVRQLSSSDAGAVVSVCLSTGPETAASCAAGQ